MLERMWEPTLGDDKMAWTRRGRKQKVQLFVGEPTLLERRSKPSLGDEKMPWLRVQEAKSTTF